MPETSSREAALLLGHVLDLTEAQLLARDRQPVPPAARERFQELLARRLRGEPVAYLLGRREFFGRPFAVDSRVLIPRPETEHLVERALALPLPPRPRILDVGTGSGCVAITLALELPGASVTATDLSPAALAVARANARQHEVDGRVRLVAADLTRALDLETFDLVVSNPPYVSPVSRAVVSREVLEHEPASALFADEEGLSVLARLLRALEGLRPGVPALMEIGMGQDRRLGELARTSPLRLREIVTDYGGIPRIVVTERR